MSWRDAEDKVFAHLRPEHVGDGHGLISATPRHDCLAWNLRCKCGCVVQHAASTLESVAERICERQGGSDVDVFDEKIMEACFAHLHPEHSVAAGHGGFAGFSEISADAWELRCSCGFAVQYDDGRLAEVWRRICNEDRGPIGSKDLGEWGKRRLQERICTDRDPDKQFEVDGTIYAVTIDVVAEMIEKAVAEAKMTVADVEVKSDDPDRFAFTMIANTSEASRGLGKMREACEPSAVAKALPIKRGPIVYAQGDEDGDIW